MIQPSTFSLIQSLHPPIRGIILDMDGVLWRGNQPIGDLPAIFKALDHVRTPYLMATNNATATPQDYVSKLSSFGVRISDNQVINSAQALSFHLHQLFPTGGPVFLIGEKGISTALEEQGFYPSHDGDVIAVVAGLDRLIDYAKLRKATLLIRAGVPFFGTNPDKTFPVPEGLIPGAGSILAALEASSGVKPVIAGKPARHLFDLAMQRLGSNPQETISIGDRLDTDIAGGQSIGCRTGLVLSGVTTAEEANVWTPSPDLIAPDLMTMLGLL